MRTWDRIVGYLLLWVILLIILVAVSVIRHWGVLAAVASSAFSSTLTMIFTVAIIIGLLVWIFRLFI